MVESECGPTTNTRQGIQIAFVLLTNPMYYVSGTKTVLVLNHIDVVLEALVTKMNDFAGRPKIYSGLPLSCLVTVLVAF